MSNKNVTLIYIDVEVKVNKAEYKDLNVSENLNYIKYNSKSAKHILQPCYLESHELCSAVLQKISFSPTLDKDDEKRRLLFTRPEYKAMIRTVNNKASFLDEKNLVDTFYGLAKTFKTDKREIDLPKMLNLYLQELETRCKLFNKHHITFLSKAFMYLKWEGNTNEISIREAMKLRVLEILPQMDLFSLSSFMKYIWIHSGEYLAGKSNLLKECITEILFTFTFLDL